MVTLMRRLALAVLPALSVAACRPAPPSYRAGSLTISDVVSPEPVRGGPGGAYFTVTNAGATDSLIRVSSPAADTVSIHQMADGNGAMVMGPVAAVALPAGTTVHFAPGHDHVMLEALRRPILAGDSLTLILTFRHAGVVAVRARVVPYRDLESVLDAR